MNKKISKLQLITLKLENRTELEQVEMACEAGADWVQLRMKKTPDSEMLDVALKIRELTKEKSTTFIVNDSLIVAKNSKADGIHIGSNDLDPQIVRNVLGDKAIVGVTVNSLDDAQKVVKQGVADYVGVGPYSLTDTKENLAQVLMKEEIQEILNTLGDIPAVLIGGVQPLDLENIKALNSHGIAVASGVMAAENLQNAYVSYCQGMELSC